MLEAHELPEAHELTFIDHPVQIIRDELPEAHELTFIDHPVQIIQDEIPCMQETHADLPLQSPKLERRNAQIPINHQPPPINIKQPKADLLE